MKEQNKKLGNRELKLNKNIKDNHDKNRKETETETMETFKTEVTSTTTDHKMSDYKLWSMHQARSTDSSEALFWVCIVFTKSCD